MTEPFKIEPFSPDPIELPSCPNCGAPPSDIAVIYADDKIGYAECTRCGSEVDVDGAR